MFDISNPIIDMLLPRKCFSCDRAIDREHLCVVCSSMCHACEAPCLNAHTNMSSVFYYDLTIKKLIINAKFKRDIGSFFLLISLTQKHLKNSSLINEISQFSPQAITYVPTHWRNRFQREIDLPQGFAQLIAQELGVPWFASLARARSDERQALRTRAQRQKDIAGSFRLVSRDYYEKILIVDDVVTTGSTIAEVKKMLAKNCKEIVSLTLAKTP